MTSAAEHFDRLASQYSRLRSSPDYVDPLTDAVAELGGLRGRRVLDVGCGTGAVLGVLTRAFGVRGDLDRRFTRAEALDKLHGRAYSTFTLMSGEEYERGVAAAEAGLPDEIAYTLRLLNVVGVRP
jgi:SAM-dependent methyltransferase